MNNSNTNEFSVALRLFTEMLGWEKTEVEHLRQDLIEAGLIFEVGSEELISAKKFGRFIEDDLGKLAVDASMADSHESIIHYAFRSFGYLRSWFYYLAAVDLSGADFESQDYVDDFRRMLNEQINEYHDIFGHLLIALQTSFGINLSQNRDNILEGKALQPVTELEQPVEDTDCATIAIPLESFNDTIKLGGPEIVKRHQQLDKQGVITELGGRKVIILSRYMLFVFDDLSHLRLRSETLHSEEALEDYAFFSFQYLQIWTHLLLSRAKFESPDGGNVSDESVQAGWKNALDYFQKIYRFTRDAIVISLERGFSQTFKK